MTDDCPLCGTGCTNKWKEERIIFECPDCGQFILTDKFREMVGKSRLQNIAKRGNPTNDPHYKQFVIYLRHTMWMDCVKKFQREAIGKRFINYPSIVTEFILDDALRHFRYLNLSDQIDNAIVAFALQEEKVFSGYTSIDLARQPLTIIDYVNCIDKLIARLIGTEIIYTIHSSQSQKLIHELNERGYINYPNNFTGYTQEISLTLLGWERYNELQRGSLVSDTAFMAMEFSYSNWAYTNLFQPAVEACGFKLQTVEERPSHGSIPDDIELKIKRAPFVIVDISHGSNGAYWEAGFATALSKPVIYTCDTATWAKKESDDYNDKPLKPHFDIAHRQIVIWDKDNPEAEINKKAPETIKAIIRNNIPNAKLDDL